MKELISKELYIAVLKPDEWIELFEKHKKILKKQK